MAEQTIPLGGAAQNRTARALLDLASRQQRQLDTQPRVRVRVASIPQMQVLPGGCLATPEPQEFCVTIGEAEEIAKLYDAEDAARVEHAKKHIETRKNQFLRRMRQDKKSDDLQWGDVSDEYEGPAHWPHMFRELYPEVDRPVLPLTVFEIVERDLPSERDAEEAAALEREARMRHLREAAGLNPDQAEIQSLRAELAELKAALQGARSQEAATKGGKR